MWCTNVAISVVAGVVVFFVVGSVDYRAKSVFTKNSNICLIRYNSYLPHFDIYYCILDKYRDAITSIAYKILNDVETAY